MSKAAISVDAFREKFPKVDDAWQTYARARFDAEEAEAIAKAKRQNFREAEWKLIELMEDEEVGGVPDSSDSYASTARQWDIACNQGNKLDVERYLSEVYGDVEVFKTFVLDKAAIRARLKGDCEAGTIEEGELPEFFNLNTRSKLMVKRWEKKRQEFQS
jgi:hypothetical protein